jgi:hypothetical protein
MRLIELIRATRWAEVKPHLLEAYPDSDASGYEHVFLNLRSLEVRENPMRIRLEWIEALEPGEPPYVDVNGSDGSLHRDREDFWMDSSEGQASRGDKEVSFALDLTPWEEWLGMNLEASTFEAFTQAEIVAHCLWEMTWHGFDQRKTQAFREQLKATATSLQAMTPEERNRNTIPIEDLESALESALETTPETRLEIGLEPKLDQVLKPEPKKELDWEAIDAQRREAIPMLERAMDELNAMPGPLTQEQRLELVGLMTEWNQAMGFYELSPRPLPEETDTDID